MTDKSRALAQLMALLLVACVACFEPRAAVSATKTAKSKSKSTTTRKSTTAEKPASKPSVKSKSTDDKPATKSTKPRSSRRGTRSPARTAQIDARTTVTTETLPALADAIVKSLGDRAKCGVSIRMADTGQVLYEYNANEHFIPASNRKIFTGALALDQLGPDFQFRTYLYHTGTIDPAGNLKGNLIIRPQGDPTFNNQLARMGPPDWIYRDWVKKVQAAGIKFVSGKLIVDCSEWSMSGLSPKGWTMNMMQDNYAPQTSPLTINENIIEVKVKPGPAGEPAIIEYGPSADGFPVINNTQTNGKGPISVKRNLDGRVEVSGGISARAGVQSYSVPCDNPTLFAAAVFRHHLKNAGIPIAGTVEIIADKQTVPPPTSEKVLAAYVSPPLRDLLKFMMKESNNHFAEQIFAAVSAVKTGNGSYKASRKLEDDLLQRAGINVNDLHFEDGCGLSLLNQVTPSQITLLLRYMLTHPTSKAYTESMAVAGRDGTLRGRMVDIAGRVLAKTGTIDKVSCLSGYVIVDPQHTVLFSTLVNESRDRGSAKSVEDRLCQLIARLQF